MTPKEFSKFWASTYPNTIPISNYFRHDYGKRWFRIHSLPDSKRYAEGEEEWHILLDRQNLIISELLGDKPALMVVDSMYLEGENQSHSFAGLNSIRHLQFVHLSSVDLHSLRPDEYELGTISKPMFTLFSWRPQNFDDLLRKIAQDELRAFFISIDNNCIIAPYDGGIDFIVKDVETRDAYKHKYQEWLSIRHDGL